MPCRSHAAATQLVIIILKAQASEIPSANVSLENLIKNCNDYWPSFFRIIIVLQYLHDDDVDSQK